MFSKGNGSTEVINGYKRFGFPNWGLGEGKIEGRHILIIALSEHHVDYMNRKGRPVRYYVGRGTFHRCVHRAWRHGSGKL